MSSFSLFFPVSLSLDFSLVASVSLVFSSLPFFLIHCVSFFFCPLICPSLQQLRVALVSL